MVLAFELGPVLPALIDGQGCPCKCNKSGVVKHLSIVEITLNTADTINVDGLQFFYHIIWPGGSPSDLALKNIFSNYSDSSKNILVFNKYQ